jgi:hypothetical protein
MLSLTPTRKRSWPRLIAITLLSVFALALTGCSSLLGIKREVKVSPLLSPLRDATPEQLIAEVNRLATVRSIRGKVDIQFQDTSFAETGVAEKYRTADGTVTVQRPGQIYLVIQVPFIGTDVAQMTSDGQKFRVAVLQGDEKYRRFVLGTNNAPYSKLEVDETARDRDGKAKIEVQRDRAVSVLSNLRPQHFTDALLIGGIEPRAASGYVYAKSEAYEDEKDTRPRASKNDRVVRAYYVLDELAPGSDGIAKISRRFWFDRVDKIRLARMQNYDESGALITDVVYGALRPFAAQGVMLPGSTDITRPQDRYKLTVSYQAPESVTLDRDYPAEAFVLQNKWSLPEVDLDNRPKTGARTN